MDKQWAELNDFMWGYGYDLSRKKPAPKRESAKGTPKADCSGSHNYDNISCNRCGLLLAQWTEQHYAYYHTPPTAPPTSDPRAETLAALEDELRQGWWHGVGVAGDRATF